MAKESKYDPQIRVLVTLLGERSKVIAHVIAVMNTSRLEEHENYDSFSDTHSTVIHLFQPDSLELRGHLVMFRAQQFKVKLAYLKN